MIAICKFVTASATTINSYAQGAAFDKCIHLDDWNSKTLADDITLHDRDTTTHCCPVDSLPGVQMYNKYVGAQIVCGFQDDGTVSFSTSTSNGEHTCTYNHCFVWKSNLECEGGGKQMLNGCCAASADCATNACGFKTDCKNYNYKNAKNVWNNVTEYCTTYHKNYKMEYTSDKADDISDGKLQIDKVYVFTPCAGGVVDDGGNGDDADSSPKQAATLASGLVALGVAMLSC